jgi:hypothetical protein
MYQHIQQTNKILFASTSLTRSRWRRGLPRKEQLLRTQAMWIMRGFFLIPFALAFVRFGLSQMAQAVTPAPDGGYHRPIKQIEPMDFEL